MKSLHPTLILIACFLGTVCTHAIPEHPRLLVTEADWQQLPERRKQIPAVNQIIKATIARADVTLDEPLLLYQITGRRMLSVSRNAVQRVTDLATAWKVTGRSDYLERCKNELLNVSRFHDWHPSHHLDTAEMQLAVAIGYDWLFDEFTAEEKALIESALLHKGLQATFERDHLRTRANNWNQVCMSGMLFSAIALLEVEPEFAKQAIEAAKQAIPTGLKGGYPAEGAYAEGGGYWSYGTTYSILSVEALRSAKLGSAGILSHPGFLESGDYLTQVYGNSGLLFNYGDNRIGRIGANPATAWMARETRNGTLLNAILPAFLNLDHKNSNRHLALAAFWFPSEDEVDQKQYPLHFKSGGKSPIALHRTGHGPNDLFLGIKAGAAGVNHGHMDAGSFVIDWAGERWASDLGVQDYHPLEASGINLFEMSQDSDRWSVFRLNNFSHNTLTYNGRLHRMNGAANILASAASPKPETLLDLTAALDLPAGASAERRFTLGDEPATVTIVDRLTGLKPGDEITWNLMTPAETSATESGFKLLIGDATMSLDLTSPQAISTSTTAADSPPAPHDQPNPGMHRIQLKAKAGCDGEILIHATFTGLE